MNYHETHSIFYLLIKILIDPVDLLKSNLLETYSKRYLNAFFLILVYIPSIILANRGQILFFTALIIPLFVYLANKAFIFLYFLLINLCIKIHISYIKLEALMLPYLFIYIVVGMYTSLLLKLIYQPIDIYIQVLFQIWFNIQIYLILRYKLQQNIIRSFLVTILGLIVLITLYLCIV